MMKNDSMCSSDQKHQAAADSSGLAVGCERARESLTKERKLSDNVTITFRGMLLHQAELAAEAGLPRGSSSERIVERLYLARGEAAFRAFNGSFAIAIHDRRTGTITLARDHLGIEPLFYRIHNGTIDFGADPMAIARKSSASSASLAPSALYACLLFNYNPLSESMISGIDSLRPGSVLTWRPDGTVKTERFWTPSFEPEVRLTESDAIEGIRTLLADAVEARMAPSGSRSRAGVLLSGGLDSSAVVWMLRAVGAEDIETFTFRCQGGKDESPWAGYLARECGASNCVVDYGPEDATTITNLVQFMTDPFEDAGITIASYLLARQAAGSVGYMLTGDGGDELFAGHPVYVAERMAAPFDRIGGTVRRLLSGVLSQVPDPRAKKSAVVYAKRFIEGLRQSPSLGSNRWRIYYSAAELQRLLAPDVWREMRQFDPLGEIAALYREAEAPPEDGGGATDRLSRSLYVDYFTVVGFYIRRMRAVGRATGIQPRFPLLDPRLVEFAARIPSKWKLPRSNAPKDIFRRAMRGVMPPHIVDRPDKTGHTVPFKQWLRSSGQLKELVCDMLSTDRVRRRGLFTTEAVAAMIEEHMGRRRDHSHRLWTLAVLELWMEHHGINLG